MKKILVTGAGGYIGNTLATYLQAHGYEVTGTYRNTYAKGNFHSIKVDLCKPFEIEKDFDVVIHAAGEQPERVGEHWKYCEQDFRSFKHNNVDTMENIISFSEKHSIKRMIYLSSIGIYGEIRSQIINENSDRMNPDMYGITKYMGEIALKNSKKIQGISIRMPGVIGPSAQGVWLTNIVKKLRGGGRNYHL